MAEQSKSGGKSKKIGRNSRSCQAYKVRESQGRTAKTRRIVRALTRNAKSCPGWFLTESGLPMRTR